MQQANRTIRVTPDVHQKLYDMLENGETMDDILRDITGLERQPKHRGRPRLNAKDKGFGDGPADA